MPEIAIQTVRRMERRAVRRFRFADCVVGDEVCLPPGLPVTVRDFAKKMIGKRDETSRERSPS